jgi:shikimate dehydrogenase
VDPVAAALGAANTLVPRLGGWYATNTDAPGMVDAFRAAGVTAVADVAVLGAGGTARAALAAAATLGAPAVTVYARRPEAVRALAPVASAVGIRLRRGDLANVWMAAAADVVISTLPAGVADDFTLDWRPGTVLFDAIYHPWPTPLAASAAKAGLAIVSGLDLLLAQAVHQFELFTGVPAPVAAMRAALDAAALTR